MRLPLCTKELLISYRHPAIMEMYLAYVKQWLMRKTGTSDEYVLN